MSNETPPGRLWRALAALVALSMVAASCGGPSSETTTTAGQAATTTTAGQAATTTSTAAPQEPDGPPDLSGVTLNFMLHPTPFERIGGAEPGNLVDRFQEATGATVNVITAVEDEQKARMQLEFAAESPALDVVLLLGPQTDPLFMGNFIGLDDFVNADPEFDWDDMLPALRGNAVFDGEIKYVPMALGLEFMYYRTDIYEANNVAVATTPQELDAAVRAVNSSDVHGIVLRGTGHELVQDFWTVAGLFGASELRPDGMCGGNTDGAAQAVEMIKGWLDDGILPADFFAWGRDDLVASVQTGRAATVLAFHLRYPAFINPADATIDPATLGWAEPPGEIIRDPTAGGGYAIPRFSQQQEAAFEFIKFLTNKEHSIESVLTWGQGVYRQSHLVDEVKEAFPPMEDWLAAAQQTQRVLVHEKSSQINDVYNLWLTRALQGQVPIQEALDSACAEVNELL